MKDYNSKSYENVMHPTNPKNSVVLSLLGNLSAQAGIGINTLS